MPRPQLSDHQKLAQARAEIARAVELTACGPSIFGSDRTFPVEVFVIDRLEKPTSN